MSYGIRTTPGDDERLELRLDPGSVGLCGRLRVSSSDLESEVLRFKFLLLNFATKNANNLVGAAVSVAEKQKKFGRTFREFVQLRK